jgi:hypothetical protein
MRWRDKAGRWLMPIQCSEKNMMRRDLVVGLGLFVLAFAIRLIFAARLVFPPLDDPAFYIQTARNLAAGRGLVIDVIYNYWVPFASVTHPSHEYWMPLASVIMAGSLRLFGDSLLAAQLPGVLTGAFWPVITYGLGRWVMPRDRRWSVLAALLVAFGTVPVYQSIAADSMAIYTVLSACALLAGARAIDRARASGVDRRAVWLIALSGFSCGLSYLTRSHGSLLPVALAIVGAASLWHQPRRCGRLLIVGAAAYFAVVGPWWIRNTSVFGTAQPIPLLSLAATTDNNQWYNYAALPSLATMDWGQALGIRWTALWQVLGVIMLLTLPYGLIGLPAAVVRREPIFRAFNLYTALLLISTALIIPASGLSGSFYHSAGLISIWLAVAATDWLRRLTDRPRRKMWSVAAVALTFGLIAGQAMFAWPGMIADSRSNQTRFTAVTQWLRSNVPPDQPVITNEAHSLNYASGYATLTLPNQEALSSVAQLADRYGAHFVVMLRSAGRYPAALDQSDRAIERFAEGDVAIYELQPD